MKRKLTILLTAVLLLTGMTSWGQYRDEIVAYTLTPTEGSNNSYAGNCDIEIDGITWNLTGNSQMIPWRIGGKNITNVDRELYSKTPITDDISKIEIEHGTANNITVNSLTLVVSSNADFSNPISILSGEFAASATTTFTKPNNMSWENMYFKLIYNVTNSTNSNRFVQFVSGLFYTVEGTQPQETVATPTFTPEGGTYTEAQTVSISCATEGATIRYTTNGSDPTENSATYLNPLDINETTTVKAKAWKEGYLESEIAEATFTIETPGNPQMTVSANQIEGFQYVFGAGPSQTQSFTVSGSDLQANVTITPSQEFEITTEPNGFYFNTLSLSPTEGVLAERSVYVRMKANLAVGAHTGSITLVSGDLNASIALSGTVNEQPIAVAPTFTPASGNFITAQTVSISSTTEGASIHYTTDGTEPTENSLVYSQPITVSSTTTVKAITVAIGYQNSPVAEATYTIVEPIAIAEARALADNEYACVEGTVIFIDGRNVYIQDATAGIDLYMNSNTVPTTLAIGDMVRTYGKKTTYNNLVELTGIAGNNANVFAVVSTGNTLPEPAVHTIAEINDDFSGSNMIQSTRVTIEQAIIGAINTNGNTTLTQDGNSLIIYRIPNVPGMIQGDWVTLTGIVSCYNGTLQLRVASADDVSYTHRPVLTASPTSLSGFTYDYEQGGPSEVATFLISGNYLTDNVAVYPSESFEVSTMPSSMFRPENPAMIYIPNSGHFYDINISVRMKANLEAGDYNEQIYAVSENADTLFINVSGTVTGGQPTPPPTPVEGNYVRISDLSQLTEGAYIVVAARFDENASNYYAMTAATTGKPTGVLFTSAMSGSDEVLPATIADEEATYYWVVNTTANGYTFTNANGEVMGYTSGTNFATGGDNTEWSIEHSTAGDAAMVPGYTGFVITNVNNEVRAFSLNSSHNFGPYHTQNMNGSGYNFYLDLFVKTEGGEPPMPTVATPTFTPEAGTYFEEQTISIACATDGATIHYTMDGTDPTENSPVYSTPININETTTLKAIALKEGYDNSAIAEATYTIQAGMVVIFDQDWEGEMNGWTFVTVEGSNAWTVNQYQGNHYAYANGYNGGVNEQWCISPGFNMHDYGEVYLTFRNAKNYTGPDLELKYSTNYDGVDPTAATWWTFDYNMSPGSYTWVESGAIPISITPYPAHNCYIAFKYTSTETEAAAWEVDDIMLVGTAYVPNLTVTPNSLSGFTHVVGEGPSASQYFTLSGVNIGPAPGGGSTGSVIIQSNENEFEVSLDNETFSSQVYIDGIDGTLEPTPIYVRMNGPAVGQYTGTIEISASSSDETSVALSGTVTEQPVPGGDYVRISDMSQLVAGNRVILAARYNETANAYLAAANTLTSGKLTTTEFTSTMNGSDETIPATIMADEDSYYWTVDVTADGYTFTNANGDMIGYGNSGTNFVMNGNKTVWTISTGVSAPESLVPEYFGFNIVNFESDSRAIALRVTETESVLKAYSTGNMTSGEYNFFLDIFMQGEGGTCTVAAPTFSPEGGTYYEAQEVTLNCSTPDATIWYSLISGNGPWIPYTEAITVEEFASIWAYAEKEGCNDSPVVNAGYVIQTDLTIIFNQDWEEDWHGWTEVSVAGDTTHWTIAQHNGNHYAYMNAYQQGANEDWLISPAFNLDSYSDVVLTFVTAKNYNGPDIEVYFSNDYDGEDPTEATWQEIECALSQGSWTWTESGEISLDDFSGSNCYIAFKYTSTETEAAGWEVDDILLVSGGGTTDPYLVATPNALSGLTHIVEQGPSEAMTFNLTGGNFLSAPGGGYGSVTLSLGGNSPYQISFDGEEYWSSLYIELGENSSLDTTIFVRLWGDEIGQYDWILYIEVPYSGLSTIVTLSGQVLSADQPAISDAFMPYYIQGNNGSNNNRVPVATAVYFENLEPNTTYRYTNQFVDENDGPETAGAGNVIYANVEGFYRSTSPSLATEGGYGEFTTDENGEGFAWFINEPTANARFTPGNHVYLRIRLNDGHDGTTVAHTFTTEDYSTVLNFGNEIDEYSGSAFYAKSEEAPMTFAMMFATYDDWRPTYSTPIETTGIDYGSINQYANFYKEEVTGKDGWFGGILPNDNENGINIIWILDMDSYVISDYYTQNGEWAPEAHTVNPIVGLDEPIFIDLTDDGVEEQEAVANVKVWSTDHEFVIENGESTHFMMTVYNILGQPMMQRQINAGSTERISHSLAAGVYIIRMENNLNKVSVKVIVK